MYKDFRTICKEEGYIDISLDIRNIIEDSNKWQVIAMPAGYGKTTVLSMLYYYLDRDEDARELFKISRLAKEWEDYEKYRNKYIVLALDFSDFCAKSMDEAKEYIYGKILELYKRKAHYFFEDYYKDDENGDNNGSDDNNNRRRYRDSTLMCSEFYLDILDGKLDQTVIRGVGYFSVGRYEVGMLERSLNSIISIATDYNYYMYGEYSFGDRENKPVILLNDIVRLEIYAQKYGYLKEMHDFLLHFLDFEPDKVSWMYIQVGDERLDKDYGSRYMCYHPDYVCPDDCMWWRKDKDIQKIIRTRLRTGIICHNIHPAVTQDNLNMKKYADDICITSYDDRDMTETAGVSNANSNNIETDRVVIIEPGRGVPKDMEYLLLSGRLRIERNRRERLEISIDNCKKEDDRYSLQLDDNIPRWSVNMGRREMRRLARNDRYKLLNDKLKYLYSIKNSCKDYKDIYNNIQNIRTNDKTDWKANSYDKLVRKCNGLREGFSIRLQSSDKYWDQIRVSRNGSCQCGNNSIKVYVSVKNGKVGKLYSGAIEYLIRNGEDGFATKVSRVMRDDMICFWLARNEFDILEEYFIQHKDMLGDGCSFIASRNKLGISHDFSDIYTHNAQQAIMIWDYINCVHDESEVDLENMYRLYIYGWNGMLNEGHRFRKDFMKASAQSFVILLDTLDILLGDAVIDDDSFLLCDDEKPWHALGRSCCWGDVGKYRF